jgi:hypothetical protein
MKEADVRDPVTLRAALNAAAIRAELVRTESHALEPSKKEAR